MNLFRWMLLLAQALAALRVCTRLLRTAKGQTIARVVNAPEQPDVVTILIPALNEERRLAPCLQGAAAQGREVREIIVIDGGSTDHTCDLVRQFAEHHDRVRLLQASPSPGENGKAGQLQAGLENGADNSGWILTLDADVRPDPLLVRSLLAHAESNGIRALSVATRQTLSGAAEGLIHPSMLATLVYRFGIPGHATRSPEQVQANGQCFLVRRDVLLEAGGFSSVLHSVCEDVTLARSIAASGHEVGFYESDRLVAVEMYAGARDAWDNWTRSLPMRDRFAPGWITPGMIEVLLVQALPQWIVACSALRSGFRHPLARLNLGLLCVRFGVLAGMARAYQQRPWSYWVSPLLDLPVALRIVMMARKTRHTWRGRTIVPGESG